MTRFVNDIVKQQYGLEVYESKKLAIGAGSNTYFLRTDAGKFILKNASASEINNPQNEPALCEHLLRKGLPVSEFVRNLSGEYLWSHDGAVYHMQKYVEGETLDWHTAGDALLDESAQTLAKIHVALEDYPALPVGIGEGFFRHMTPGSALQLYKKSYKYAKSIGDAASAEGLDFRIALMKRFTVPPIRLDLLTRKNTHGDYFISQLICGENKINAVIDWTTACVHPVVWEIIRSYIYAAPECANGEINHARLVAYAAQYLKHASLTAYDIQMMPYVFYYQIAVCDYYNQYYQSTAGNRDIYLRQAILSTKLMRWFDKNIDELSAMMVKELKPSTPG